MCIGIYAGDSRKLSVRSCFKDVWNMEQKNGSVVWGLLKPAPTSRKTMDFADNALAEKARTEKWSVWSLRNGLQTLPDRIGELLSQNILTKVKLNTPVTGLILNQGAKALEVHTADGVEVFDGVIAATYAGRLADVLSDDLGKLKSELRKIPAVTVAVVNIEFPGELFNYAAFGYLIPSIENSPLLGVIFDSCLFGEHNNKLEETTRLTCMMGGAYFEKHFGNPENVNEEEMIQTALKTVAEHLGFDEEPLRVSLTLHKDCIPQYHVGHHKIVRSVREEIGERKLRLSLIGSSYDGVSVNDCVLGGRLAAREVMESL
ncbi:hypothetical protein RvY_16389 [Ramazzottius varieornatus]|uniref:Protoporphyrinogen oxidase n=1 Tax=Ramazzottius varieornatus TaxID=947166 RepID=A0A1D1VYA1_RAMVA|nr:hypothetical protein RvY_16389 [Ramazzottius varieornatus]